MGLACLARKLWRAEQGATAVAWAIALPMLGGAVALGVDVGNWYLARRSLQTATDIAAIDAGYHLNSTVTQAILLAAANHSLSGNGYTLPGNLTVTVHYPPTSGTYSGNTNAVEVITSQPQSRYFSRMFMSSDPSVGARAVSVRQPAGSACVLALNPTADNALKFQGNTTINLSNCTGASNSSSASSAVLLSGSSVVSATSIYAVGGVSQGGASQLTTSSGVLTGGSPISDPYALVGISNYVGCSYNNYNAKNTTVLSPGVYCNGLSFAANSTTTLSAGTYIIDRGDFKINNNATVTGNGVTIILTSSTSSNYATVTINGGATVNLSAPTTGTYAGMLMYQDRNAPYASSNSNKLNGGATMSLVGAVYFPSQGVQFSGNSSNNSGSCTKIVADTVTFIGNSYLNNNCPNSVTDITTQGKVSLME